ncbi:MAG: transport protein RbsD/FucU [Gemmatimonadetes bacterium]|nr:RbsD/FucU family protein [Gemmatimonadota bacterium]NNM04647.1 transport protein RbsD/FucU [Gemmatimonadota bacterium]
MLEGGILNPHLLSLLARIRHTNTLVIADRGFPSWPGLETVDISLVDDVPTVRQVLAALKEVWIWGEAFMAEEFIEGNGESTQQAYATLVAPATIHFEPHVDLKARVPQATGLIRTGDTTQYGNIILESA